MENASIGHMPFEFNYGFYPKASHKKDVNPYFQSKLANKLATNLKELMATYKKNFLYAGRIANILKQSKIENLIINSFDFFGCCI